MTDTPSSSTVPNGGFATVDRERDAPTRYTLSITKGDVMLTYTESIEAILARVCRITEKTQVSRGEIVLADGCALAFEPVSYSGVPG